MLTTAPRGMNDVLPGESRRWQAVEETARRVCRLYGYGEIRTPVVEHTEVFTRTVGEATDVVQKEMYTFQDKAGRWLTLRPEGTAPVARAYLQHGLDKGPQPFKVFYLGAPMFRHERPQAGRYRQHYQFGVEALGTLDPALDAEIILLVHHFLSELGLGSLRVHLNSIGDERCRPAYREKLRDFLRPRLEELCPDCRGHRFEKNPLRILDCKVRTCRAVVREAPRLLDHLCDECREHFRTFQSYLKDLGLEFRLDTSLVRGFDYYTKTVFEVVYTGLGAQSAVCGGGRYDGLVEALGGPATPGIGFGLGLERLLLTLERQGLLAAEAGAGVEAYVCALGALARRQALGLLDGLRRAGVAADVDYLGRSLKAQLRAADRAGARLALIVGEDELARGLVTVRRMADGAQDQVALAQVVATVARRLAGQADAASEVATRASGSPRGEEKP